MKQFILKHKKPFLGLSAMLLVGGITMSFQDTPIMNKVLSQGTVKQDTVPSKHDRSLTMKEFDELMHHLDKDMSNLRLELKEIDVRKIEKEIESSLKELDVEKIMKDVELSLKEIDLDKINAEITSSLKEIDIDKVEEDVSKAMAEARKELEKAKIEISKIDKDKIRKELNEARAEMEKSRIEIRKIDTDKIMKDAQQGMQKAKDELRLMKEMFNEMEKDGLIDTKQGFKIEYKDKELLINGVKQPEKVADKYRKYIRDENFEISIDKD